jgi:hemerythrin-like domain-containing protein
MSTLSDVIKHDHRELEEYYDNILKASSPDEKVRWQNQFTWELARHSVGEEIVVYPVLEKQVSGGQQLADRDRAEHAKASSQSRCVPRRFIGVQRCAHTMRSGKGASQEVPEYETLRPRL